MSKPWNAGRESAEDLLDPLVGILKYMGAHPEVRPEDLVSLLAETKAEPMPFGASGTSFTMEEWLEHDPRAEEYSIRLFLRAFRYGVEQGRRMAIQRLSDGGAVGFMRDAEGL